MIEIDELKTVNAIYSRVYGEPEWDEITEQLYAQMLGWA